MRQPPPSPLPSSGWTSAKSGRCSHIRPHPIGTSTSCRRLWRLHRDSRGVQGWPPSGRWVCARRQADVRDLTALAASLPCHGAARIRQRSGRRRMGRLRLLLNRPLVPRTSPHQPVQPQSLRPSSQGLGSRNLWRGRHRKVLAGRFSAKNRDRCVCRPSAPTQRNRRLDKGCSARPAGRNNRQAAPCALPERFESLGGGGPDSEKRPSSTGSQSGATLGNAHCCPADSRFGPAASRFRHGLGHVPAEASCIASKQQISFAAFWI